MTLDQTANFVRGGVSSSVASGDTTINVVDASIYPDPANGNYNLVIWDTEQFTRPDEDPDAEVIRVSGRDTTNDTLTVSRGQEGTTAVSHPNTSELHLSATSKFFTDIDSKLFSSITISGNDGINGGSSELGGTINVGISGNLSLDGDLTAQDGEIIWDESETYIPQGRLQNDAITVAGNSVSLGNSTAINHANISNIFSDDHHTRYSDSEAVSAADAEISVSASTLSGLDSTVDTKIGPPADDTFGQLVNLGVTSSSASGDTVGYTLDINSEETASVEADADGSGGINNKRFNVTGLIQTSRVSKHSTDISQSLEIASGEGVVMAGPVTGTSSVSGSGNFTVVRENNTNIFTEDEVRDAINTDSDHGSTASHNYFAGGHSDLSGVTSSNHHTKTTSASDLTDVSADSVSDAHHTKTPSTQILSMTTSSSQDVNQTTSVQWDEHIVDGDAAFSHDPTVPESSVTINEAGTYELYCNIYGQTNNSRTNPSFRFRVNSSEVFGRTGSMYARNSDGHTTTSTALKIILDLSSSDTVDVYTFAEANSGTVTLQNRESVFTLKKIR